MPRVIAAILLIAVLVVGGGIIANTAYQAGLSTAVTTATGSGGTVVTPVAVPYGVRLRLASIRLRVRDLRVPRDVVLPVHHLRADPGDLLARRPGPAAAGAVGWGGPGSGTGHGYGSWEGRAHDTFEDWHRRAHGEAPAPGSDDQAKPTGTA